DSRPVIVDGPAQEAARVLERRRQTRPVRRTDRRTIRPVVAEARNQRMRMEIRKAPAALRVDEGLVLLRLHGAEVVLSRLVNRARLGMVDSEIQAHAVPDMEWIASE